jgi:hypothetical protein
METGPAQLFAAFRLAQIKLRTIDPFPKAGPGRWFTSRLARSLARDLV